MLLEEVLHYLNCKPGGIYCDGTVGLGGHAERILETISPDGVLVGVDLDSEALVFARERLKRFGDRVVLVRGNYMDLPSILESIDYFACDGVLLDLGLSSYQLQDKKRGFSFSGEGQLSMNFDANGKCCARDIVNKYPEARLADVIYRFGEERWARRIAKRIVVERSRESIESTEQLVRIIESAIPYSKRARIHPATRTFQALRIEVNNELENLNVFLQDIWQCLKPLARVCIISYHSLEDRQVKRAFKGQLGNWSDKGRINIITKKPIRPSESEVRENPRSRSARLRVAEWSI